MQNNLLELINTNSDCAQYTGTVTIASYLGERLIQKETQHNAGLRNLFEFISSCLQGHWREAKDKLPCKLVMLEQHHDEILTDEEYNALGDAKPAGGKSNPANQLAVDTDGNHYWSSTYAVCSPIMYDSTAITTTTATSSAITYHFRVPFLSLVGGSTIKKLMLLPPKATNYQTDACAYFVLENGIQVPDMSANYTVIIDWTLEFKNTATSKTIPN